MYELLTAVLSVLVSMLLVLYIVNIIGVISGTQSCSK